MRFLETNFGEQSGPAPFAPGHAVLFRKEALDLVGGYDVRYRLHYEDGDICKRMGSFGWETHYVAQSRCVSIQRDSLRELVTKELPEMGWQPSNEGSLIRLYWGLSRWTVVRAARNVVKGRFHLLPIDVAIWASGLWMATARTVRRNRRGRSGSVASGS